MTSSNDYVYGVRDLDGAITLRNRLYLTRSSAWYGLIAPPASPRSHLATLEGSDWYRGLPNGALRSAAESLIE